MHGSIHIKVEYPEAVENKKNMLLVEKSMLEIVKHMRIYDVLRRKEFSIKSQIKKDFAHLITLISAVESHIPGEETSFTNESYKREVRAKEMKVHLQKKVTEQKKSEIENQIEDIRSRLAQLG
jgi:hypothetical protein